MKRRFKFWPGAWELTNIDGSYDVNRKLPAVQTQHGYPLVKGDGSKEPTRRVHTFGAHWGNQMGDDYELQYFNTAK